jgi:hypothetical protein
VPFVPGRVMVFDAQRWPRRVLGGPGGATPRRPVTVCYVTEPSGPLERWRFILVMVLFPGFAFLYGAFDGDSWSQGAVSALITLLICVVGVFIGGNHLQEGGRSTRFALGWTLLLLSPITVPAVVTQEWGRGGGSIRLSAENQALGLTVLFLLTFAVMRYVAGRRHRSQNG